MSTYVANIVTAAVAFPLIAAAITVPYMVWQYRKLGSVPWLHTLAVYSFLFYLMCAYFLVLLPLPADRSAIVPYAQVPQLVPFHFVQEFLAETDARLDSPATWLAALADPYIYEALFNVLLLVPLGAYLRYYFRRTWWQTLLIGFAVTLSFELSQLTGLWGVYEHPYRLFDVDDLITNTAGAMAGFWLTGPAMRVLPDVRLVNAEAHERGMHASVTRRALSFALDLALSQVLAAACALAAAAVGGGAWEDAAPAAEAVGLAAVFFAAPCATGGRTPAQALLRLRIVRPDAAPARWYQPIARYGLLFLIAFAAAAAPAAILYVGDHTAAGEAGFVMRFVAARPGLFLALWGAVMAIWAASFMVRAWRSARRRAPFVMLNGILSNTRVMTEAGVQAARERAWVLDVEQVVALERAIAADGTPLDALMGRAGRAVADEVRAWVPDPAPVCVLAGSGNNGGDGWVCALDLARRGYPVTIAAPQLAERISAEPARSAAMEAFSAAAAEGLPLRVLVSPDADVLADAVDGAEAVVDAMLGTGFAGNEVRGPYAAWIEAANRRRFEGARSGRGRHRERPGRRGAHERRGPVPMKAPGAPFAVAVDVPSGLSAQTGAAAAPCFCADVTVTMIAYKPGLASERTNRWTGAVKLAPLVDTSPYRAMFEGRATAGASATGRRTRS